MFAAQILKGQAHVAVVAKGWEIAFQCGMTYGEHGICQLTALGGRKAIAKCLFVVILREKGCVVDARLETAFQGDLVTIGIKAGEKEGVFSMVAGLEFSEGKESVPCRSDPHFPFVF